MRARQGRPSIDDVDQHTTALVHRRCLDDRAQRLRSASAPPDHLPIIIVGDTQLEHDRAVVLLELLDRDIFGIVDQPLSEVLSSSRMTSLAMSPLAPLGS